MKKETLKDEKTKTPPAAPEKNAETAEDKKEAHQPAGKKPAKVTKVGAMLKEMRLQQGLKIADVAKRLCIRKTYIEAIEDSNYKEIPPLPYGIGFIRSYAKFLGLNSENIVELYKEETNISEPQDIKILEPQPEATVPGMQYLLISLLAIALVYIGWNLFNDEFGAAEEAYVAETTDVNDENTNLIVVEDFNFTPEEAKTEATDPVKEDEQIVVSDATYPLETQNTEETNKQPAVAPAGIPPLQTAPVTPAEDKNSASQADEAKAEKTIPDKGVFIEVLKETWVEVKDEHTLYLSKVLYEGDTYTVPEGSGMILSFGRYDGAHVYINGRLTEVASPNKKTNIALDPLIDAQH